MTNEDKTKGQRVAEKRVAELQMSEGQRKRKEDRYQQALEYAESVINTMRIPIIALNQNLNVISVSRSPLCRRYPCSQTRGFRDHPGGERRL
jgi:hypothetical protein